jgi:hypothetical protein
MRMSVAGSKTRHDPSLVKAHAAIKSVLVLVTAGLIIA